MAIAIWNGVEVARSEACVEVEGNLYFPHDAVEEAYLQPSPTTTRCTWKGTASYYDLVAGGRIDRDAAWTYRHLLPAAADIAGYIAFRRDVQVRR